MTTTTPKTNPATTERDAALAELRALLPAGTTVYTILRHVSRSGMPPHVSVKILTPDPAWPVQDITYRVATALGRWWRFTRRGEVALIVDGAGMDMGFHVVYTLAQALFGPQEGTALRHEWL